MQGAARAFRKLDSKAPGLRRIPTIGALIIRIGFGGIVYYSYDREHILGPKLLNSVFRGVSCLQLGKSGLAQARSHCGEARVVTRNPAGRVHASAGASGEREAELKMLPISGDSLDIAQQCVVEAPALKEAH